jgi:hypothetical protein
MSIKGKQELKRLKASLEESRVNGQDTAEGEQLDLTAVEFHTTIATLQSEINKIYNHTHAGHSYNDTMSSIRSCISSIYQHLLPKLAKSIDSILERSMKLKQDTAKFAYLAGQRAGRQVLTDSDVNAALAELERQLQQATEASRSIKDPPF